MGEELEMGFGEAVEYLESFTNYEKETTFEYSEMKLGRVRELLTKIGDPQKQYRAIHIAGTKGKGSTCAMLFSILKAAKYKVGLYTSPHLINVRERIRLSFLNEISEPRERLIKESEFAKLIAQIKKQAIGIEGLTFFEILTVVAFKFFADKKVDFVILETGLGGRLDATNVVDSIVCGITNISLDHTQILGDSIKKIAQEKAGIIKETTMVAIAAQPLDAFKVIEDKCQAVGTRLYEIGKDFVFDPIAQDLECSLFDFKGMFGDYDNLRLNLLGQHQIANAALALAIIQLLTLHDIVISILAIKEGLEKVRWPGRLQLMHRNPFMIFDGAQNAESAHALRIAINMLFIPTKTVLILGVSKDKDVDGICENLCRSNVSVIVTKVNTLRALDTSTLALRAKKYCANVQEATTVKDALELAKTKVDKDGLILLTGSLYLIGEALKVAKGMTFPKISEQKK